jgi:hypothetical protein
MLTVIKISVLLLIIITGILALCGFFPTDVDFWHNISFDGTSASIAPYASALFYVTSCSGYMILAEDELTFVHSFLSACMVTQASMPYNTLLMKSR